MLLALALALVTALPQDASPTITDQWVGLVLAHQPGVRDAALVGLGGWGGTYLKAALDGLNRYEKQFQPAIRREVMNTLFERAALLHLDMAILAPRLAGRFIGLPGWPPQRAMRSADGMSLGASTLTGHWRFGRVLLDRVTPTPANDAVVHGWYEAVGAHLLADRDYADALQHFDDADRYHQSDAEIDFLAGVLHEMLASAAVQEVVQSAKTPIRSARHELETAEHYFERAARARSDDLEVQLHLGRVLHLLGRDAEAEPLLASAAQQAQDPVLQYYAQMVLGSTEEALGQLDGARGRYERAAGLQPTAQSPLIALSHLARERGQRQQALGQIRRLMALPSNPDDRRDPWPDYDNYPARNSGELLDTLYAAFRHRSAP